MDNIIDQFQRASRIVAFYIWIVLALIAHNKGVYLSAFFYLAVAFLVRPRSIVKR